MRLSSVSIASSPKSSRSLSRASAYASSMKRTPSIALRMTRSVLIAVSPTYWPTSPARSTSTRWPRLSSPIERYICASSRATVVLPVPGLPRKTRCCVVATSGRPGLLAARLDAQEGDERTHLLLHRLEARQRVELGEQLLERARRAPASCAGRSRSSSSPICVRSWSPSAFSESRGLGHSPTVPITVPRDAWPDDLDGAAALRGDDRPRLRRLPAGGQPDRDGQPRPPRSRRRDRRGGLPRGRARRSTSSTRTAVPTPPRSAARRRTRSGTRRRGGSRSGRRWATKRWRSSR